MDWTTLLEEARKARTLAYAPYSGFAVGASVLTTDGSIFKGCNVENRSYGLTLCAERVAVASAVAAGQRSLEALVVVTDVSPPARPCGMCLDTLVEFNQELPVLLANLEGEQDELLLKDLLPQPFRFPTR